MGLDIYVGSLTRYLAGDRESARPSARQAVLRWRKELARPLATRLEQTWDAASADIETWARRAPTLSLEPLAQKGFSVLWRLSRKACEHKLPMLLDD